MEAFPEWIHLHSARDSNNSINYVFIIDVIVVIIVIVLLLLLLSMHGYEWKRSRISLLDPFAVPAIGAIKIL